ncbi:hypothetical protein JOC86_000825 [Bacillus pakistanensis]|uniref:Uncharacterized protein n=1 Tax=Rossellomorea pakistanensis TaxID=992288 RepID=A0ABS2N8X5_9BACI|nr:hypothetical protein [Bacillus pakistanensis]MBM7584288.1 hypothetical protein [Bacillus pakistanensis]
MNILKIEEFLIQIERESKVKNYKGNKWNWEVKIAQNKNEYYGIAYERALDIQTSWIELESDDPLEEMKRICKEKMER